MGELAALNERLMGNEAWIIRKRVEYLKKKRSVWEGVYDNACRQDAALTLDSLERAMSEVRNQSIHENVEWLILDVASRKGVTCPPMTACRSESRMRLRHSTSHRLFVCHVMPGPVM